MKETKQSVQEIREQLKTFISTGHPTGCRCRRRRIASWKKVWRIDAVGIILKQWFVDDGYLARERKGWIEIYGECHRIENWAQLFFARIAEENEL